MCVIEMLATKAEEQYLLDEGALSPEVDRFKQTFSQNRMMYTEEQAKDITTSVGKQK